MTVPTRGGGASAANGRQTGHGNAKDEGRRSGEKEGGKYDSELKRLTVERKLLAERRAAVTRKGDRVREIGEEEASTGKAKENDTKTKPLGTREGRAGAAALWGNAAQIPKDEVTPSVALPKLTRAKYQSQRSQP
jgi:hypothetical protein